MKSINKKSPRKYLDDKIVISYEYYENHKPSYICNICSQTLVRLTDSGGNNQTYWCRHCGVEWDPKAENIRRESKLEVPDKNIEPEVTSIQFDYNKGVAIHHEPEIKGSLKALKDKGIKITHYEEHIPK